MGSQGCDPGARNERNDRATPTRPRSQGAVAVGRRARGLDDDEDRVADAVGARESALVQVSEAMALLIRTAETITNPALTAVAPSCGMRSL